jgi:hypothetical protein
MCSILFDSEKRNSGEVGPHIPMLGVPTDAAMWSIPESMPTKISAIEIRAIDSSKLSKSTKDRQFLTNFKVFAPEVSGFTEVPI